MGTYNLLSRKVILSLSFSLLCSPLILAEAPYVSIYDDISDSTFGRSVSRSIVRGVRQDLFALYRTLPVERGLLDSEEEGFLTPLVLENEKKERLEKGFYPGVEKDSKGFYRLNRSGVDITFSLEKAGEALYREIDDYYADWPDWQGPVREHYRENWIIRIHRAENVFEPWVDRISYNEALLAATLIADKDQWLWGIHDGFDYLEQK
jgi:hypothetical protein